MTKMSVDDLYYMSDAGVKSGVTDQFINLLKISNSVKKTFFSDAKCQYTPYDKVFVDNVATAFVCNSIGITSKYDFYKCVDYQKAQKYWEGSLAVTNIQALNEGQALYNALFPNYCKSDVSVFNDYLTNNPSNWAKEFSAYVTTDAFINTTVNKCFLEANWLEKLNLVFYKIFRLDKSCVDQVLSVWKRAYPDKNIIVNWDTYQFIPYPNFSKVPDLFMKEVDSAMDKKDQISKKELPSFNYREARYEVTYAHGKDVEDFLEGNPSTLKFTTGKKPKNTETKEVDEKIFK